MDGNTWSWVFNFYARHLTESCGFAFDWLLWLCAGLLLVNGKIGFPDEDAEVATVWLWAFNEGTDVGIDASPVGERFM